MKTTKLLMLAFAISLNTVFAQENKENDFDFPVLEDRYLGQKPPGLTPELFAPGIVSTENLEIQGVFAPSMKEFYYVRQRKGEAPKTHVIQYKNGVWQEPVEERHSGEIFISTDDNTMHLGNKYRERTA